MALNSYANTTLERHFTCWLLIGVVFILLNFSECSTIKVTPMNDAVKRNESGICRSVDIRNSISSFENLRGCRVVEGFVQILLLDNVNESLFANLSFPELTEITDYFLMYRVNGLRSLGQLFPKLAVIRGQNLFFAYSFIIYEVASLQEIGLHSLTDITHGTIRIERNPSLCFVESIDWDLIASEHGEHYIQQEKPEHECPLCPGVDRGNAEGNTSLLCTISRAPRLNGKYLCWNSQHCQKVCKDNCRTCNSEGKCCDKKCLGGCDGVHRDKCHVCKNITTSTNECVEECEPNTYMFLNRRCLTKEQCIGMRRPLDAYTSNLTKYPDYPYKIFNGSCLLQCPTNFVDDYENHTCSPCKGRCRKVCPGINVDSIATIEELRGCTHINGSLEIKVRGGKKIVQALEANLNMIEEVDGYVKIVRSFPLVTLSFLKNLKRIRGNHLDSQKYVFVVLDNQNLELLWDMTNSSLKIDKGRLFFHFNPKLCLQKIEAFANATGKRDFTEFEVAANGDKIACNISNFTVKVNVLHSKGAVLNWPRFEGGDYRKLLGYMVSYIQAPNRNISIYDGRDACGGDGWKVNDVGQSREQKVVSHFLTHLIPYTQYAFYVKTYTIANEQHGAQSPIQYFRTLPAAPSHVRNLHMRAEGSDTIYITWEPPEFPYGNVTKYKIIGEINKFNIDEEKDYCNGLITLTGDSKQTTTTTKQSPKNETCDCSSSSNLKAKEDLDYLSRIHFEDELQNRVYVKKSASTRSKRDTFSIEDEDNNTALITTSKPYIKNNTKDGVWHAFTFMVYGKTEFRINNLRHYTRYRIIVLACRERVENDIEPDCSIKQDTIENVITERKKGMDNITNIRISNQSTDAVLISWDEPLNPNGQILTYQLNYTLADKKDMIYQVKCITQATYRNNSRGFILRERPGNYSLRIRAYTEGGHGAYSHLVYFKIEESSSNSASIIVTLFFIFFVIILGVIYYLYKRKKKEKNGLLIITPNPDYVSGRYTPDDWEVSRSSIELIHELGQGSFGMVYEGFARDIKGMSEVRCAVKTVNEHATNRERIEFLNEASVMKRFDTTHVVKLLGVVSQGQPTLVVMELMANGDLKSYLRSHRPEEMDQSKGRQPPTLRRILQMAIEISDGMSYLSAKKFVHRDLAARNCMVAEDLTVKIGDFGMTRDIYETDYYRKGTKGLLPVRWMAPESLKDGVFTSNSDVWSYGVVLWEMATLAHQPYQGLSNDQVLRYVIDGGIMERPENCPDKLYNLMKRCWLHRPSDRPSFLQLCSLLVEDASPSFCSVSYYHSPAGVEARTIKPTQSISQDDPTTPLRIAHDLEHDFSPNSTDQESDFESETRIKFDSFHSRFKDPTANGYIGGCTNNGAPT